MPPRPSKVPDEYAQRSVCRNHLKVYDGVARGSMRRDTWSNCEYRSLNYGCRYSHTIFNTKRILKLGDGIVHLNYGHGFEKYGAYESPRSGWDIEHNGEVLCSDGSGVNFDLPKALLLAELKKGITYKDAEPVVYEKKQTLCQAYQAGVCSYLSRCRFDHDLIDARRLEKLVRTTDWGYDTFNFLTVECHISAGKSHWKITMKPDALRISSNGGQPIRTMPRMIPTAPFSREGDHLLQVIRDLEMIPAGEFSPGESTSNTNSNVNNVTSIPSASIFSTKPVTPVINPISSLSTTVSGSKSLVSLNKSPSSSSLPVISSPSRIQSSITDSSSKVRWQSTSSPHTSSTRIIRRKEDSASTSPKHTPSKGRLDDVQEDGDDGWCCTV